MKAALYYGPHDLRIEQTIKPKVEESGIIVRVRACGICGSDLHFYERGGLKVKPGTIMGHEFSGDVVAVGKAVQNIKEGDRVAAASMMVCNDCYWCASGQYSRCQNMKMGGFDFAGAYAEYAPVPLAVLDQTVFKLPANLSYEAGAIAEPLGIGIFVSKRAEPDPSDVVVIFGAGMIGLSSLMAFRAAGVSKIIVSELTTRRRQAAEKLGADVVIDASSADVPLRILQETQGKGADIAVECTGLRKPFLQSMKILRNDGKLMQVGVFDTAFEFNPVTITTKNLHVIGCLGGDYAASMQLLRSGTVRTGDLITHEFPLDNIKDAFETQLKTGESIKVLVKPYSSRQRQSQIIT